VRRFIDELEYLKVKLLEMSTLVEAAIERSMNAVTRIDRGAAQEVFEYETRINTIELEIDDLAINLLALHQPVAADLRFIIAALKINSNLERMGDLSVNIAHSATDSIDVPMIKPLIDIPRLSSLAQSMVRKSLEAFVQSDVTLARLVLTSDDAVDSLRRAYDQELISCMEKDPQNIPHALNLLWVIHNLERIADHSTNIAEDVLFHVQGIEVRHHAEGRWKRRFCPEG
jgi:phosphate transport system protein